MRARRTNGTSYGWADERERRAAATAPEPADPTALAPARAVLAVRDARAVAVLPTTATTGVMSTAPPETMPMTSPRSSKSM